MALPMFALPRTWAIGTQTVPLNASMSKSTARMGTLPQWMSTCVTSRGVGQLMASHCPAALGVLVVSGAQAVDPQGWKGLLGANPLEYGPEAVAERSVIGRSGSTNCRLRNRR